MRKKVLKIQQVDPNDVKKIREEEAQKVFAKQIYLSLMVSAKYCYAIHELRLHQNDRCKRFTLV